jgi:hypothetical protein
VTAPERSRAVVTERRAIRSNVTMGGDGAGDGYGRVEVLERHTHDARRRELTGFRSRGRVEDEWGRSESLDPDNVGDIADEGAGHRG